MSFDEGLGGLRTGFGGKSDFEVSVSLYDLVVVVVFQVKPNVKLFALLPLFQFQINNYQFHGLQFLIRKNIFTCSAQAINDDLLT
jgi:hypothetical protein